MLSINAHAVSLSLHFLASDAFSPSNAHLVSSLCYSFSDTLSLRKICNLQMRSCLLLVLIAVVAGEILYAGHTYREPEVRMIAVYFQ